MKRTCWSCKKVKNLSEFRNNRSKPLGKEYVCVPCKRKMEAKWRDANRDSKRMQQRDYYAKNRERITERRRKDYDPIKGRARWLAGKIRAEKCIFCDKVGERHHKCYLRPLDIVFLCKSHHKQVHDGTITL